MNGRNYGEKTMMNSMRSGLLGVLACGLTLLVGASVYAQSLQEVMQQRGLTENDLLVVLPPKSGPPVSMGN